MRRDRLTKNFGLFLFIMGVVLLLNGLSTITGFSIIDTIENKASSISGLILVLAGLLISLLSVENKVIGSRVKSDPLLLRVAHDLRKKPYISRDVNHLIHELNKGNTNPGLGTKTVFRGVYELRARNGGRVYYREVDSRRYEVLGYSDKDTQSKVIHRLKEIYE